MAALPFTFTGDEALLDQADQDVTNHSTPGQLKTAPRAAAEPPPEAAPRQLTARALVVGLAIGAVLAAGNVYTGLKSGFIDGGALTAALLSFTFFATFKRWVRLPFGPLENNIAQTAAASAAVMGFVHGLMGAMPARALMGQATPPWALWTWGITLAMIGVAIAVFLRRKLVVDDALPFPTGIATAELIKTVHSNHGSAARQTRFLIGAALAAGALTWFRDGGTDLIPQAIYLPLTIGGISAASLTLGVASSPLMAATGMFIGLRSAVSLLLGGAVAWGIVAPIAVRSGWTADANYGTLTAWLVWPALGMMMSSTLVPFVFGWRAVGQVLTRTLRDARNSFRPGKAIGAAPAQAQARSGIFVVGVAIVTVSAMVLAWTGWRAFGFSPYLTCAALILSVLLSGICARAAGETDMAPVGAFGTLSQILFARGGTTGSLLSGAIVSGNASEVAQSMWAFRAGHNLRASVRAQVVAQVLGAVVGSLVVVPAYLLIIRVYPLGTERMPAASAVSWRATALALNGGLDGLPSHGLQAIAIAFGIGTILSVLGRTRVGNMLPSPMAMGIAMITPVSLSAAAALGAGAVLLARRRLPRLDDGDSNALAAGLLAGESILGVIIAALAAWRL